jgi:hypothetical protein
VSDPHNKDAWAFALLGATVGAILAAAVSAMVSWETSYRVGGAHGQCLEVCFPDKLVATLSDDTCRCDHYRLVRPRSEPAREER